MARLLALLALLTFLCAVPSPAAAQNAAAARRAYEACIVRYASQPPSPQASSILQRACFYKYLYGKGTPAPAASAAEQRRLSKIYTPEVCDCLFERMPSLPPGVPAPVLLDTCVKNPKKAAGSEGKP